MAKVYLDTSFLIGMLENQEGCENEYRDILKYEKSRGHRLFTSQLTIQEFLVKYYHEFLDDPNCEDRIDRVVESIHRICDVYAISNEVCRKSARFMSLWARIRNAKSKKFRWDAIHLATADTIGVERLYVRDGDFSDFPSDEIPGVLKIVCPPTHPAPELSSWVKEDEDEPHSDVTEESGAEEAASERSDAAAEESAVKEVEPAVAVATGEESAAPRTAPEASKGSPGEKAAAGDPEATEDDPVAEQTASGKAEQVAPDPAVATSNGAAQQAVEDHPDVER